MELLAKHASMNSPFFIFYSYYVAQYWSDCLYYYYYCCSVYFSFTE